MKLKLSRIVLFSSCLMKWSNWGLEIQTTINPSSHRIHFSENKGRSANRKYYMEAIVLTVYRRWGFIGCNALSGNAGVCLFLRVTVCSGVFCAGLTMPVDKGVKFSNFLYCSKVKNCRERRKTNELSSRRRTLQCWCLYAPIGDSVNMPLQVGMCDDRDDSEEKARASENDVLIRGLPFTPKHFLTTSHTR